MKRIAIIYHKSDFDGICSYAIVRSQLEVNLAMAKERFQITPMPWDRGDKVPDTKGYHDVYVLDICLPIDAMYEIKQNAHLVWIDHHATSIEQMKLTLMDNIDGIRELGVGACELTWRYMHKKDKCPRFVLLLSAYDVWDKMRLNWEQDTLPFQYGMRNRYGLDAEKFFKEFYWYTEDIKEIIAEGKTILKYIRQSGNTGAQNYGFDVTVGGDMKGLAILTDQGGSAPYEENAKKRKAEVIVLLNRMGDDKYKVSCYCPMGKPRKHLGNYLRDTYGGGGHEGAAGAVIDRRKFVQIITERKI